MKTIKTIGVFLLQKIVEVWEIVILQEHWRTPSTVIFWVRTIVYVPTAIFLFYWWTKLVWYISKVIFNYVPMNIPDYYSWGFLTLLVSAVFCLLVIGFYLAFIQNAIRDFRYWFSSNWAEAKKKVEGNK